MAQLKYWDPVSQSYKTVSASGIGPTGPTGPTGPNPMAAGGKITVSTTAPSNPAVNDVWIDVS